MGQARERKLSNSDDDDSDAIEPDLREIKQASLGVLKLAKDGQ